MLTNYYSKIYFAHTPCKHQGNFLNKSRRTLTEFGPVVLCARVFIQDPHELFSRDGFMFVQIGRQLIQLAAIVFQNGQCFFVLLPYQFDNL